MTADTPSCSQRSRPRVTTLVWVALIVGSLLRCALIPLSSPEVSLPFYDGYGWPADHANYVQWARQATSPEYGLWSIYTTPPQREVRVVVSMGELYTHHGNGEIANYPPLGIYLVYLQGLVHRWVDPTLTVNTAVARVVFDAFAVLGDIALAWGVWAIAGSLFGRRKAGWAFAATYLMPPVWLDSCWWGQTDSWVIAPIAWMIWAMTRRRWILAGVLWGAALSLKPQAVLAGPLWLFMWLQALFSSRRGRCGAAGSSDASRIVAGAVVGLVVLNLTAVPFYLSSGGAWFYQSYLRNLFEEAPHTTLRAFNLWYIDLMLTYDTDPSRTIAGITKDTWGKLLLVGGLLGTGVMAWRAKVPSRHRVVVFAGLWFLATVMLPTRVHERYILLCLPFLVLLASGQPRWRLGVGGLIVVACFQMTVYHWLQLGTDTWSRKYKDETVQVYKKTLRETTPELHHHLPKDVEEALALRLPHFIERQRKYRPYEWGLTVLALVSAGLTVWAGATAPRPARSTP